MAAKNKFAGTRFMRVQLDLKPLSFDSQEKKLCFAVRAGGRCKNPPSFRLVALESAGRIRRRRSWSIGGGQPTHLRPPRAIVTAPA